MRDLPCKRLQLDEIWAFGYAKQRNVPTAKAAPEEAGDIWTWVAIDADTKLVASYLVGDRDATPPTCSSRTSPAAWPAALRSPRTGSGVPRGGGAAFGADVDYASW